MNRLLVEHISVCLHFGVVRIELVECSGAMGGRSTNGRHDFRIHKMCGFIRFGQESNKFRVRSKRSGVLF